VSPAMTEIPEHLLARSKSRRDAIGQSGDESGGGAAPAPSSAVEKASSSAPAAAAGPEAAGGLAPAKAPAAPAAPAAPPDRPEVAAAKARKKIPYWAATALVAMPVWAFLYAFTLEPPTQESPILSAGGEIYSSQCASCHGAEGAGGVGPAFADGAVVETFTDYEQHVLWIEIGSVGWLEEVGPTYGDTEKPVNGYNGQNMPAFGGSLSEEEILEVVRYEREVISGYGCEPLLAEATGEECEPGTENPDAPTEAAAE
jgi:mono/diheme cytochrome c family protein